MRRLSVTLPALAAAALFGAPASAHHSMAMFDMTREVLIEGTVARFDWVNPHMYLIVEYGEDEVVIHFDNSGDHVVRTVHMNAEHPVDVRPTRQGHSIGRWEGDTLVIDAIAFEPNPSGIAANVPSSPGKHTVERLMLTDDRTRLRYEITVEDPVYLSAPATLTQRWDHRPDLEFSPPAEACDPEVAERYLEYLDD